jgi:hypothetical protein
MMKSICNISYYKGLDLYLFIYSHHVWHCCHCGCWLIRIQLLLVSIFILPICVELSFLLLVGLLLSSFMPVGIIINPNIALIPTITRPTPAHLATHIPLDHVFSPNMMPANHAIHNKFIQPKVTIRRKYGQQQPRQ